MKKVREQFGKNLKNYRQSMGISQEALAEKASLHRTYIGSAERGERNISLENIVKIANALDISPSTLLQGIE
ncbi:helix-turn-helix domain-containing protein [Aeromonas veronii]|uniref:helix-turn-helix domain-containing protein n=1 Tax=Aeromonas veronii TaxID=654 RepID=UPI00107BF228|nr:helix-turn-helix transcriptional regulator [Aeromonas veronii]MCF5893131.1 helix-turn-helix domain-containing protein [Aeromonas veronii]QWL74609.1 helix-turn-helix transcriptional regulator [Aeromonas hydrophila]